MKFSQYNQITLIGLLLFSLSCLVVSGLELRPRWGEIEGAITNQTDLNTELTNRYTKGEVNALPLNTETFTWVFSGNIFPDIEVDGFRLISATGNIERVWFSVGNRGNSGNTIVDINKGSLSAPFTNEQTGVTISTIYTNQANRPTLTGLNGSASDNAIIEAPLPDIISVDEGDFLSLDIDDSVALDSDLVLSIVIRYAN